MLLEILLLFLLARVIGSIVADKGYSRLPFQALLFLLTLVGQLGGGLLCLVLLEGRSGSSVMGAGVDLCFGYLGAAVGGVIGVGSTFLVVLNLADNIAVNPPSLEVPADATAKFVSLRRARRGGGGQKSEVGGRKSAGILPSPAMLPPAPDQSIRE
jgi:hypothetical protein